MCLSSCVAACRAPAGSRETHLGSICIGCLNHTPGAERHAHLPGRLPHAIRVLEHGGTLPWLYAGTPYQKVIDPDGLTTEFIRCPDPTRVVVAKISRRRVA